MVMTVEMVRKMIHGSTEAWDWVEYKTSLLAIGHCDWWDFGLSFYKHLLFTVRVFSIMDSFNSKSTIIQHVHKLILNPVGPLRGIETNPEFFPPQKKKVIWSKLYSRNFESALNFLSFFIFFPLFQGMIIGFSNRKFNLLKEKKDTENEKTSLPKERY